MSSILYAFTNSNFQYLEESACSHASKKDEGCRGLKKLSLLCVPYKIHNKFFVLALNKPIIDALLPKNKKGFDIKSRLLTHDIETFFEAKKIAIFIDLHAALSDTTALPVSH